MWHIPLIPVLGKLRQVDFREFKASQVYIVSPGQPGDPTLPTPLFTPKKERLGIVLILNRYEMEFSKHLKFRNVL